MFNPDCLDLARRRRGLTKTALAEALGVSIRMMTAYERGEKVPNRKRQALLAQILDFPDEFFTGPTLEEPPSEGSSFRAFSTLTAKQRDQAFAAGALALRLADWIDARFSLPAPSIPRFHDLPPETAALAIRSEWGLGELPVRNMIHLLEARGARVFSLVEDCRALDAFSFWRRDVPYVFLNTMKSGERSRMDAAHELGHLALHWKGTVHGREAEREAEQFGSAFLMPRGSVLAEAPRGGRLVHLLEAKRRWKVSVASLAYRMHTLDLLTEWQYRKLFEDIGKHGYRLNEPHGIPHESSQVLAKVFRAIREDGLTMGHVAQALALPLDEVNKVIFGLVLTSVQGMPNGSNGGQQPPPVMRVV